MTRRWMPAEAHIRMQPTVTLDDEAARWLVEITNVQAVLAGRGRDADRAVFEQILALVKLGSVVGYVAGDGDVTKIASAPTSGEDLVSHGSGCLTAGAAADVLGMGIPAVRRACREGRLIGQLDEHGHYLIDQESVRTYRPRRRAA